MKALKNFTKELRSTWQLAWNTKSLKVSSFSKNIAKEAVYDLCMPRHHNYFAGGALVHNCHLMPKKGAGMYRTFIKNAMMTNPKLKVVGLTASPFRLDGGSLIHGDGAFFDGLSCHITVKELIEQGHLTPLTAKEGINRIETSRLKTQNGEYKTEDQVNAFHENDLTNKCIDETIRLGAERKSWMIFCASVDHCKEVADILNEKGIKSKAVYGSMTDEDREQAIEDFDKRRVQCLVSVNILTTGFDVSHVDLIVLMRSTQSASLYLQICGRGMRLHDGKDDCLVLDYGENILRHGAVDEIVERQIELGGKKKGKKGEAVMKRCESCGHLNYAAVRQCVECGAEFSIDTMPKIQQEAARLAILSTERKTKAKWHEIHRVQYSIHQKIGKPNSLKVTYVLGNVMNVSEWICFNHEGFARKKAIEWMRERYLGNVSEDAMDTDKAFLECNNFEQPTFVKVNDSGKYPEIVGFRFESLDCSEEDLYSPY